MEQTDQICPSEVTGYYPFLKLEINRTFKPNLERFYLFFGKIRVLKNWVGTKKHKGYFK